MEKWDGKRALVLGIGGGGDIASTIPTAEFIERMGGEIFFGSVIWDRYVIDPKPGPRALDELEGIRRITETTAWIQPGCHAGGIPLTVGKVSEILGEIIGVDITKGVKGVVRGLEETCKKLHIDTVIGIDAGGDAIAIGHESGLCSPLCDSLMVSALSELPNSVLGVFGFGSDGELRKEELLRNMSIIAFHKGYLGAIGMDEGMAERMKRVVEHINTEASAIPLKSFSGELGGSVIRKGRYVEFSLLTTITFFFDPRVVCEHVNRLAKALKKTVSLEEANEIIHSFGVFTELDYERMVSKK